MMVQSRSSFPVLLLILLALSFAGIGEAEQQQEQEKEPSLRRTKKNNDGTAEEAFVSAQNQFAGNWFGNPLTSITDGLPLQGAGIGAGNTWGQGVEGRQS